MARSSLKMQGFSTKGIGGDLSAGLTKAIDSVTAGPKTGKSVNTARK